MLQKWDCDTKISNLKDMENRVYVTHIPEICIVTKRQKYLWYDSPLMVASWEHFAEHCTWEKGTECTVSYFLMQNTFLASNTLEYSNQSMFYHIIPRGILDSRIEHPKSRAKSVFFCKIAFATVVALLLRWKLTKNTELFVSGAEIKFPPLANFPPLSFTERRWKIHQELLLKITIFHETWWITIGDFRTVSYLCNVFKYTSPLEWRMKSKELSGLINGIGRVIYGKMDFNLFIESHKTFHLKCISFCSVHRADSPHFNRKTLPKVGSVALLLIIRWMEAAHGLKLAKYSEIFT